MWSTPVYAAKSKIIDLDSQPANHAGLAAKPSEEAGRGSVRGPPGTLGSYLLS